MVQSGVLAKCFRPTSYRSVGHSSPYRTWVQFANRAEECGEGLFDHIWDSVNAHLGTNAHSFPELVEQLGIMRFNHFQF
jgi:hypothetical protein